ncbi:putative LPS assembly protein LptD [Flavobacteriales bacterium]|nr:putative LPS assembly protein LptD [Flavobacteriales bacterium]
MTLLISNCLFSQDTIQDQESVDTVNVNFKVPVDYNATDSMRFNIPLQKVYLYGNAHVTYDDIELDASYIEFDFSTKIAIAKFSTDSLGEVIGKPVFQENGDEFTMDSIRYNFDSKKGIIYNVRTEQAEGYLTSAIVKKQANDHVHVSKGKYTTCDLEEPHFYFKLSKAVVIPDDKIISGPLNLWIADIPTPLGLPFGYFPNKKGGTNGIVIPTYGNSPTLGYFLQGFGYYHHFGDKFNTQVLGDIYSRGSWGVKNISSYKKRYKYNGNFNFQYTKLRISEPEFPDFSTSSEFFIRWSHGQDPKANPGSRFNANVNLGSINNFANNFNSSSTDYLSNTFNSNVRWNKTFSNSPLSMSINMRHTQNTLTEIVNLTLPEANINQSRIYPLKRFGKSKSKLIRNLTQNTGLSQSINIKNDISDSAKNFALDNIDELAKGMNNGMRHNANLNTSVKLGPFTFNPSARYTGRYYLQYISKVFNSSDSSIITETISKPRGAHEASFSTSLNTKIYGMYGFAGFLRGRRESEIRHVLTPTVNFTYTPNFSTDINFGTNGEFGSYSPFELGIYGKPSNSESRVVSLALINSLDMKLWAQNDTTEIEDRTKKKVKIIENATLSSSYDFMRDSFNLANISFAGRTRIFKSLNLNFRANLDPYSYNDGSRNTEFRWNTEQKIGTITSTNLALSYTLKSKQSSGNKNLENVSQDQQDQLASISEAYVDFTIPWQMNVSYNLTSNRSNINASNDTTILSQTIRLNGDVGLTKKWRIGVNTGFDFKSKDFNYTTVSIYRDMHCWEGQFNWIPFGSRKSYTLTINVKASILKDLRIQRKRAWYDNAFGENL